MSLKLETEGVHVVSGSDPQIGSELEEKEKFWKEVDEVMQSISGDERVVIGADFNGHVGDVGDVEVMDRFGIRTGMQKVRWWLEMVVMDTFFQKMQEHQVIYQSGGRSTQVDHIWR